MSVQTPKGGAACAKLILCGPPVASAVNTVVNAAAMARRGEVQIDDVSLEKAAELLDEALTATREAEKLLVMAAAGS